MYFALKYECIIRNTNNDFAPKKYMIVSHQSNYITLFITTTFVAHSKIKF